MKNLFKILIMQVFLLSVLNIGTVMASATYTFNSTSVSDLITESSGTYTGSINYTPSWNPGQVNSAKLTLFLSDDTSTILNTPFNAIDIPREWAQLTDIRDGGLSLGAQSAVEVENTSPLFDSANFFPFNTVFTGSDGFENPLTTSPITPLALIQAAAGVGIINPSSMAYEIDVTSLMNSAGLSGTLNFDLVALNMYDSTVLPSQFLTSVALFGFNPLQPQTTFEDYSFTGAQLTVSPVPEPSMFLLLISGLFGMFMSRKWLYREN